MDFLRAFILGVPPPDDPNGKWTENDPERRCVMAEALLEEAIDTIKWHREQREKMQADINSCAKVMYDEDESDESKNVQMAWTLGLIHGTLMLPEGWQTQESEPKIND